MTTTEWVNGNNYEEGFSINTHNNNFQYINEDTCTSSTADESNQGNNSDEITATHASIILNYFHQLYESQKGIDLEIFCGGISVAKVHRIIIASFCQMLEPFIEENNNSTLIKLDIPNSIGVSIDDLREIISFLYSGKIILKSKSILKALQELGCNQILPLLYDVWYDGTLSDETMVEDKYHSTNLMKKLKEFCEESKFIDCLLKLRDGVGVECHRWVIAAFSNLVECSLKEVEKTQIIFLEMTELESASLKSVSQLVEFIYSSKIPSAKTDYAKLRETAMIFGVNRLIKKLPAIQMTAVVATYYNCEEEGEEEEYYESHYQSEESNDYFDDGSSTIAAPEGIPELNLTRETEYAEFYNQYVEGPLKPSCSDVYDPTMEFLSPKSPNKIKTNRYKCPLCNFISPLRGTIRKHIRSIHTQETPYSCSHCCMAFKVQSNLARHLRSHSQIKPYKCKACDATYADKKNMDAHIFREHLGKKPFKCPHNCLKSKFYREETWRKHYQKFHSHLPEIPFPSDFIDETSQDGEYQ